jgi:hypothetical protein
VKGLTIEGAEAVTKSYPEFFAALQLCGARIVGVSAAGTENARDDGTGK